MTKESSREDPSVYRLGRLGKPNGLDGFVGFYVDDADLRRLEAGTEVTVDGRSLTVRATRQGKKGPQIAFNEISNRSAAEDIRGAEVALNVRPDLDDGEYWIEDLVGLAVRPGGGIIVDIVHGPAQDRLVIERNGSQFEVPFVDEWVPTVEIGEGFVELAELDGLVDQ